MSDEPVVDTRTMSREELIALRTVVKAHLQQIDAAIGVSYPHGLRLTVHTTTAHARNISSMLELHNHVYTVDQLRCFTIGLREQDYASGEVWTPISCAELRAKYGL